jgi:NAD(P)-dependent dehydrogenase (short-subunit alcohol dehydrogenase family)
VEADIRRVVAAALAQTGRIDVLVNNAGMLRFGSLEESDPAIWEAVLRVNAFAPWRFMVAVLPAMRVAGGGAIVNISSIGGLKAFAGVGLYCTSKAALQMLSQVMALEVAADNIRVNLVCPSMVEGTEIADPMFGAEGSAEYWERIRPLHPLGRNGKPEDVADAVLFLASAQSAWMTGAILNLDGGRHLATGRPVI